MISRKSRYRNATSYKVDNDKVMDFRLFITTPSASEIEFKIDTHRFDVGAGKIYEDPEKFWMIADRLEEECMLYSTINSGVKLVPEEEAEYGNYGQ